METTIKISTLKNQEKIININSIIEEQKSDIKSFSSILKNIDLKSLS